MTSTHSSPTSLPSAEAATAPATQRQAAAFEAIWSDPPGFIGYLRTINNIPIARRYMITAGVFFLVGGVQALLMRIQLGTPDNTFLSADAYNQLFTMHGTTMMFLVVIPFIEALASYFLPLMLGTRDLPFPRLTALSYWTYLFGGIFLYSSFVVGLAPDGGWFAYLPLNSKEYAPGLNMDFWDIGLSVAEVAALGAGAELIVGILRMRAPGMTFARLPIFAWTMLIVAVMLILAFTPLIVATAMLELDRKGLTQFFNVAYGGDPLLWQHLFWVFGHPEVYIMFLPAAAIVTHIVQTFSRVPLANYRAVVLAVAGTGVVSFALWLHHMFAAGMSPNAMRATSIASLLIAIPAGVQVVSWLTTMWNGRVRWSAAMHFVAGFLVLFVLGGLTGVMLASIPFDAQAHDTYFVVAHFHYVLIGGVIFPFFAAVYYWSPKVTGRMPDERLGKISFWTMFVAFNVAFFPMHVAGLLGMPRRVYTYAAVEGWGTLNLISTLGALGFALGIALTLVNLLRARSPQTAAPDNPWGSDTLEWDETSPPRAAQFPALPIVRSRHPLWDEPPQAASAPSEFDERPVHALDNAPTGWRGALCVSLRDARPLAVVHLPATSIWPFAMAVSFVFLFSGALLDNGWLALIGAAGTALALVGWFWPTESERRAVNERHSLPLPLGIAGPLSNGWWGTWVLMLVFATALLTIVACALYLADPAAPLRADGTEKLLATIALLTALLAAGATWWGGRGGIESLAARRRFGLTSGFGLDLALLLALWLLYGYSETTHVRDVDAQGSVIFLVWLFQGIVTLLHTVWVAVAAGWAWAAPRDVRGLAPAGNVALLSGFLAASWLVVALWLHAFR